MQSLSNINKENSTFENDIQKFVNISKEDRPAFNKKILQIPQIKTPSPFNYFKAYPSAAKFSYKGYNIHFSYIQNTEHPQAVLIQLHGLNGHSQTSGYFAHEITQINKKMNAFAFDQLNFGKSEGPYRGEVASFQDSVQQLEQFTDFILSKYDKKPKIFLSGWSYGGAIMFKAGLRFPQKYAGMIFVAPALRNLHQDQYFMKKLGIFIGWICPRIRTFQIKFDAGTRYDQTQKIKNDPYIYQDGFVPGSIRIILNALQEISELYDKFSVPYLLFQGGVDKLVDLFAPLDLSQKSPSVDKTTIYYQHMWHVAFDEPQADDIAKRSAEWIKMRL